MALRLRRFMDLREKTFCFWCAFFLSFGGGGSFCIILKKMKFVKTLFHFLKKFVLFIITIKIISKYPKRTPERVQWLIRDFPNRS